MVDNWRWKIVGGYTLIPSPSGPSGLPPSLRPSAAQEFLHYWDAPSGIVDSVSPRPLPENSSLIRDLRRYVRRNGVTEVVFEPVGRDATLVLSSFERAFGPPKKVARRGDLDGGELASTTRVS